MRMAGRRIFHWKNKYAAVSLIVLGLAILIVGITLAYFTATDTVTNELEAQDIEIKLYEPAWYAGGMDDAKNAEPGMVIAKDPYVYNQSDTAVYVRMMITITDADGNKLTWKSTDSSTNTDSADESSTDGDTGNENDTTAADGRYEKILASLLYLYSPDANGTLNTDAEFLFDTDADGNLLRTNANMNNPYFYYEAETGWFYYTGDTDSNSDDGTGDSSSDDSNSDGSTDDDSGSDDSSTDDSGEPTALAALAAGASTEKLFTGFWIPILKTEYYDYFDSEFHIVITAQAIAVESVESEAGTDEFFAEVKDVFEARFGS